jgi:hypothetical protein
MRLSGPEVQRRKKAIIDFFKKNPTATIARMNTELADGTMTGQKEKKLNIAMAYEYRREAQKCGPQDVMQALVDALRPGSYNAFPDGAVVQNMKLESIEPACEIAVRTGPVVFGGCGENPASVVAEVENRQTLPGCSDPFVGIPQTLEQVAENVTLCPHIEIQTAVSPEAINEFLAKETPPVEPPKPRKRFSFYEEEE